MNDDSRISKPTSGQIECITRAIITDQGKLLVCRPVDKNFYFLPGGHVEFGETTEVTVRREILEELGVNAKKVVSIGFIDNIYEDERYGFKRHEMNLLYEVELESIKLKLTETHIEMTWINIKDVDKTDIMPPAVRAEVISWLKK